VNRIVFELSDLNQGYLDGFFVGDGYSHYNKNDRHYRVEFYLNSDRDGDIRAKLQEILEKAGLKGRERKDKRFDSLRLRVDSKEFYGKMASKSQKLETATSKSQDYLMGFLSGFIDAEGYVVKGDITVTQQDKGVLLKIAEICGLLHIPIGKMWSFKNAKTPREIWRLRILTNIKHYKHISCKINRIYSGSPLPP